MSTNRKTPRFSAGELEIMSMLWVQGPVTLAEAHQCFGEFGRAVGYTTMQTRLNRLVGKGAVRRSRRRPAKYEAAVNPDEVSARLIDVLLDKVSQGSIMPLVSHLISGRPLSAEEIRELKRLIAEAEASGKGGRGKGDKR
ncbi:MAG: BlaI/MecI/CopY family transcriptional regulator [Planctomycetota bacterium]|jgi:predicted transcriptional regulator